MRSNAHLAFALAVALLALVPSSATAVTLLEPANGATTSDTPRMTWQLQANEEAAFFELSGDPSTDSDGYFRRGGVSAILSSTQTSVAFRSGLRAGQWFWHVRSDSFSPSYSSVWSDTWTFVIPDTRKVSLANFEIAYLRCLGKVTLSFDYSDNTVDEFVRWKLDFFRRKHGKPIAKESGIAGGGGFTYRSRKRPSRLHVGQRYQARLTLTDRAGNLTRTGFDPLNIAPC